MSCARQPGPAPTHAWHSRAIPYWINREANDLSERAVRNELDEWGRRTGIRFIYRGRAEAGIQPDGKNVISFLSRWPRGVPQKTAYCRTWYDRDGFTVEADIAFNCELTRFTTVATSHAGSYYLEGVLSHEIGHLLGLGHSDSPGSVMKPESGQEESWFKGAIDAETLARVRELYPSSGTDGPAILDGRHAEQGAEGLLEAAQ
jgi:hypothetical protein